MAASTSPMLWGSTRLGWLPCRSRALGLSCFAYLLPGVWAFGQVWCCVALLSFFSDHVMTGRDSLWHIADRASARSVAVCMLGLSFVVLGWAKTLACIVATGSCYAASAHFMRSADFRGYVVAHSLWHCVGAACSCAVLARGCALNADPGSASSDSIVFSYLEGHCRRLAENGWHELAFGSAVFVLLCALVRAVPTRILRPTMQ